VTEAAAVFGEDAASELAGHLCVSFEVKLQHTPWLRSTLTIR
jgi:hypothetical protein